MAKSLTSTAGLLLALLVAFPLANAGAATKKSTKTTASAKKPAASAKKPAPSPKKPRTATAAKATPKPKTTPAKARALAEGELPIVAKGAILLDAFTGRPLYEKNADTHYFPASTTKIMTALLVIEAGDLDREVEVTEEDSRIGESSLHILPGERYTRRDMLYGLMLKSANDVAHALGRDNAGTADAFAEKMTRRAMELGATNTSFRNANGLHHVDHFTTARDLALIARAAMQQPYFRQLVSTPRFTWKRPNGEVRVLTNHNRLLGSFPGTTGVKTGFTNPAQQVLVSACLRDRRELIAVVMHDVKPHNWEDSKLLFNYGFDRPASEPVRVFQ